MLYQHIPKKVKDFSTRKDLLKLPDLIRVQQKSYMDFLQMDIAPKDRKPSGLQGVFEDIFPVENTDGSMKLSFVSYEIEKPVYSLDEAIRRDVTYSMPIKVKFSLEVLLEGRKKPEIREEKIYVFDLPNMTDVGTFIINGAERVVVSQLHRSPGVIFEEDEKKGVSNLGKKLYSARIIPYRGSWIELEYNNQNELFVRINRKRKIPATVLFRAMGWEKDEDILRLFYKTKTVDVKGKRSDSLLGKILVMAPTKSDKKTDEFLGRPNQIINKTLLSKWKKYGVRKVEIADFDNWNEGKTINDQTIHLTLNRDNISSRMDAIYEIFKILRSQQHITPEAAEEYFESLFFKGTRRYDLTKVGRYKLNKKLNDIYEDSEYPLPDINKRNLVFSDIICTAKYIISLNNGVGGEVDDIDHLGNRRVRTVGEQLENQLRKGVSHLTRLIKSKMNMQSQEEATPATLINPVPISAAINKFFGTGQLSQFMAQTNPLAELTHKRRTSALGPGGLNRKRAGFEVRDVHHTHYGRICPIETPEGANIGLRTSLSIYARINKYGLIETPYRRVSKGKVTDKVEYITADVEDDHIVAPGNVEVDKNGYLPKGLIIARQKGGFPLVAREEIDYIDISPKQMVGAAAGLIPFLEHDDANRALMGSNMQRQALPLLITEPPIVATGMEGIVAGNSGALLTAKNPGEIIYVDGNCVMVWRNEGSKGGEINPEDLDIYELKKYQRSNQDTNYSQTPVVSEGDKVKKGDVLADGPATANGELALGRNLLVAFMSWEGYNFEDAVLISERLVKEDCFTSLHIYEEEIEARDLKIGSEEITRDIPNVGENKLRNLDENGIIRVGAYVRPNDILVGKVTPKGKTRYTPEVRLLKTIFGKKAEDVKDSSLRVPPGIKGKVIRVEIFDRKGALTKRERTKTIGDIESRYDAQIEELRKEKNSKIQKMARLVKEKKLTKKAYEENKSRVSAVVQALIQRIKYQKDQDMSSVDKGDDLPVMVARKVKVYIASNRKISVGDKVAGRHGNKGVISRILPEEDMPFTSSGEPVDIVLNPLSIPSRMNVGQILETHLGWAAKAANIRVVSPIFDGADEDQIKTMLKKYNLPPSGRTRLYDGRTGEVLGNNITIGYMYIMKLEHMAEDKVHARATGPYSLITRQPLGGKAMFGGQRFGEMEVWAMEGYGAAYILQEFLTYKSDDVKSRTEMHESIIKKDEINEPGMPESFRVLVKELQGLGIKVLLENIKGDK
ncbi:MAG: DNA-directed RNA polymerase subunit beta [Elusimicrobia bacterium]|nr:DNA-directed RNA polymerase subunit beta [Elusimicrobiota bacterium]